MGILDSIMGGGRTVGRVVKGVYSLDYNFHPFRMNANKNESIRLNMKIKNESQKELLTSVIVRLPEGLGFDNSGISKAKELRMGELEPGEIRDVKVDIFGNYRTSPGNYNLILECVSNYRTYGYEMEKIKKNVLLRVV